MQILKIGVILFVFLLIVAAGMQTAQSSMKHTQDAQFLTVAERVDTQASMTTDALHQGSLTCQRFLQQAARTVLLGVQSLLD